MNYYKYNDQKLQGSDLTFECKQYFVESLIQRMKEDGELIDSIMDEIEENAEEYRDSKLTVDDRVNLKLEELAGKAVDRVRIYCEFDLEVE